MEKTDSQTLYEMKLTTGMAFILGPEGKRAHAEVIEKDKEKSYRLVVNIVGKVAQGKTSLRRMLVGEEFQEHEVSTVGIEHEMVETLGTQPSPTNYWSKVDLAKANIEECNILVGKHVRERLEKNNNRKKKYKAEIKSFFKAMFLAYFMLVFYFVAADTEAITDLPWFPVMLITSFAVSAFLLFDSLRDGFGMAIGTLCLVLYCDAYLRWNLQEVFLDMASYCIMSILYAFLYFACIHSIMALSMGLSMALGFCFILSVLKPPWSNSVSDLKPLTEVHVHLLVLSILVGIWTLRHTRILLGLSFGLLLLTHFLPRSYLFTIVSGIGCGFSHVIFIKIGFDTYIKGLNPILKSMAGARQLRRFICYGLGIIPGAYITYLLEWQIPENPALHLIFGLSVIVFVELCHYTLEGKVQAAPKATINDATKVLDVATEASLKFVIRDFAGHQLYHTVHHIYMMGSCVYLIVFNMVEAKRNFKASLADVMYWLQSVYVHDRFPTVRAFLVGTRRDDKSLSKEDIEIIGVQLMQGIPRQFHNMLVWNEQTDKPLFVVENSVRGPDPDHMLLRKELLNITEDEIQPKYPIKFLYFYRVVNKCREEKRLIETIDNIEIMCAANECVLTKPGELEDILCFFHRCGEIIYNSHDNNQNQLVVLDPKALVSIMVSLVRTPPRRERKVQYMLAWQTLSDLGICTERLLKHILKNSPLVNDKVSSRVVISLLEYLDLVCLLDLSSDGLNVTGERCYLITPLLLDTLPYPQNYWEDIETDTVVYLDFGPIVPRFVFTRLVCQCTSDSHIDIGTDGRYHLNVSTSAALFTYRDSHSYKIELLDSNRGIAPGQQLLKIVVRGSDQKKCLTLVRNMCQKICDIVDRDFRKCRFKIGVMCPFDGPHEFCQDQERHIFTLYENTERRVPGKRFTLQLPVKKEFWCRGRPLIFNTGQVQLPSAESGRPTMERQSSALLDCSVLDLPPRLYSDICDDLNLDNVFCRNWKGLAELLGKTSRDVSLLSFRSPRDPCDALLQDWATSAHEATVGHLREKLVELDRVDVVRRIDDFIQRHR